MTFSACAYALKCLIDPDLPVNDGFYRLITVDAPQGTRHELHAGRPGRRRLGDAGPARRGDLPRAPPRLPRRLPAGHEGDDVPGRASAASTSRPGRTLLLRDVRRRLRRPVDERRPGRRAGARPEHRERADRGDRAQLPGADHAARARRELRGRRAASAAGSGCARTTSSTGTTTFTILADRDRAGPWGAFGGHDGDVAEYVLIRDGAETRLGSKSTVELEPGDVISVRTCGGGGYGAARGARAGRASCATCSRARSAPSAPATSTASRSTSRPASWTSRQPPS